MPSIILLVYAAWQFPTGRAVLLVLALLLALDLGTGYGKRYFQFLRLQQPRDAELTRASHGAGALALCAVALWTVGPAKIESFVTTQAAPDDWQYAGGAAAFAAVMVWGLLWFLSGVRRSLAWAGYRDSRLITRAVAKIAFGAAVWMIWNNPPPSWWLVWAWLHTVPYSAAAVMAVVLWLLVTGLVKWVLVMWPRRSSARGDVENDIAAQDFNWDEV